MKNCLLFTIVAMFAGIGCEHQKAPSPETTADSVAESHEDLTDYMDGAIEAVGDRTVLIRYVLPCKPITIKSSVAKWGFAAPVENKIADPNKIVYNGEYVKKHIEKVDNNVIVCGPAGAFELVTANGVRRVPGTHSYLGSRFRADDLIRFLKFRTEGMQVEETFQIKDLELEYRVREYPDSVFCRRLRNSPWVRDIQAVISLLSYAGHPPAYPVIKALTRDPNPSIQYAAAIALGRFAANVPEALDDLERLAEDHELSRTAFDALRVGGADSISVLIELMNHRNQSIRKRAVSLLSNIYPFEDAVPGLIIALNHQNDEIRYYTELALLGLQSRGYTIKNEEIIDLLLK